MIKNLAGLVQNDVWLKPYESAILHRIESAQKKENELAGDNSLYEFSSGHLYFGLHKEDDGWIMREWAPNATYIFLIGSFNNWEEQKKFALQPRLNGIWELKLDSNELHHGDLYALSLHWAVDRKSVV